MKPLIGDKRQVWKYTVSLRLSMESSVNKRMIGIIGVEDDKGLKAMLQKRIRSDLYPIHSISRIIIRGGIMKTLILADRYMPNRWEQ